MTRKKVNPTGDRIFSEIATAVYGRLHECSEAELCRVIEAADEMNETNCDWTAYAIRHGIAEMAKTAFYWKQRRRQNQQEPQR